MAGKNSITQKGERNKELLDWLNGMSKESQEKLAAQMGTTCGQLRQIAYGNRRCSARLAVLLDKFSGGAISMTHLAPTLDWRHIRRVVHDRP